MRSVFYQEWAERTWFGEETLVSVNQYGEVAVGYFAVHYAIFMNKPLIKVRLVYLGTADNAGVS